jgi:hypothetical protein
VDGSSRSLARVGYSHSHNGHAIRPDIEGIIAISAEEWLREEDPFTEFVTRDIPNRIAFHRSRFEIGINRPREAAVYLSAEQAWGLDIWKQSPPADVIERSLAIHDDYYAMLRQVLCGLQERHGRFVVLDIPQLQSSSRRARLVASPAIWRAGDQYRHFLHGPGAVDPGHPPGSHPARRTGSLHVPPSHSSVDRHDVPAKAVAGHAVTEDRDA